jgi:aspartyl-tRNA(Asn)/glutamyl-tRNA(Gln) amidotransferase subunit C
MITKEDIAKLAKLSRVELTENEQEKLTKDVGSILGYVDQIKNAVAKTGEERKVPDLRNVSREDNNANETGSNTEAIVVEFPRKEGNYLKVKKIIEQ